MFPIPHKARFLEITPYLLMAKRKAKHADRQKQQATKAAEKVLLTKLPINTQETESKSTGIRNLRAEPITTPWLKVFVTSVFISLLIFLAFHTDLFNLFKFDDLINQRFMAYTESYIEKPYSQDIMILTIEEDPQKNGSLGGFGSSWRKYHKQLIDALSRAGVKVIAFDMFFDEASSEGDEYDEEFGKAIQRADQVGTKVVLGFKKYNVKDGKQTPQFTPKLDKYLNSNNQASIYIGLSYRDSPLTYKIELAQEQTMNLPDWVKAEKYPVIPSLPLQIVMQYWAGRDQAIALYNKDENQLDVQVPGRPVLSSIPVGRNMDFIFNMADKNSLDQISYPYSEVIRNQEEGEHLKSLFGGKIVIVGVRASGDLYPVSNGEKRYGMEFIASATSNLLQSFYIRPLSDTYQYLLILTMCLTGALLKTRFSNWMSYNIPLNVLRFTDVKLEIPVSLMLISAAYLLTAFFVYVYARRILNIPYPLAALVITFYLMKVFIRKPVVKV